MPDLKCHDGDLNGYGCISSQFVDSLISKTYDGTNGNPQWFGKITRFRYELELPDGNVVDHDTLAAAIENQHITACTLVKVNYTPDPFDENIAYAEGELEITAVDGSPIPSSQQGQPYKFKHTLLRVWRITETKLF